MEQGKSWNARYVRTVSLLGMEFVRNVVKHALIQWMVVCVTDVLGGVWLGVCWDGMGTDVTNNATFHTVGNVRK